MSLQEKKALFNILTTVLILGGYVYYTFGIYGDENIPLINELQFWGKFMLTMIVVTIVLKILIHILFSIVYAAITKDEDLDFMDEYDKKIELIAERNGNYFFVIGFISSFIPIAMGQPVSYMFIILLISGFTGGILGDLWKIYFYRKGI